MTGAGMLVVAGAIYGSDGRWLMHRRPYEKDHGGLWEFPGGKVEIAEIPAHALCRELKEELGIEVDPGDCEPIAFAEGARESGRGAIVILLYKVRRWSGTPDSLENGAVGWVTPAEMEALEKPPLDQILAKRLLGK